MNRPDPMPHLAMVAAAMAAAGQPATTFRALDGALAAVLGHKLFTVLLHHRSEERRVGKECRL